MCYYEITRTRNVRESTISAWIDNENRDDKVIGVVWSHANYNSEIRTSFLQYYAYLPYEVSFS